MVECPKCGGAMFTNKTVPRKRGLYIQYKCKDCGHTENNRNTDLKPAKKPPSNARKFDDATIAQIRASTEPRKEKAKRWGCTSEMIRRIEVGLSYAESISPDAPRYTGRTCHRCTFWDMESERCREGWPDPLTDGPKYANECRDYTARRQ
jgi:DNA-directed RNA polymerase subunit M/transcription elongation factor TFIIS